MIRAIITKQMSTATDYAKGKKLTEVGKSFIFVCFSSTSITTLWTIYIIKTNDGEATIVER